MGLGQGDCDNHSDCCSGLRCNYDWGFKTDYCEPGPTTKDFCWGEWSDWSSCSMSCGHIGVRSRSRDCIDPVDGGKECPKKSDKQWESCGEPCWTSPSGPHARGQSVVRLAAKAGQGLASRILEFHVQKTQWKHRPRNATPLDYSFKSC